MTYLKMKSFGNGKPILFGLNRMATPFSVSMSQAVVLPNAAGNRYVTEGMFIVNVGNKIRFLPRTRLKNASATNSQTLTLKSPSFMFEVGDVLFGQAGYAEVSITGTVAENDVVVVRLGDSNYSVTADSTPTLAELATQFVTANSAALLARGVTVATKGSTSTLTFTATDSHSINVFSTSGALDVRVSTTEPGFLGDRVMPLGTIASIALPNSAGERVVTLVGNAAYVLPAESIVGVSVEKHLGIYPDPLDYTDEPVVHLAPIVEADGVYEQNLPYIDNQLKRVYDKLNINKRFYKKI